MEFSVGDRLSVDGGTYDVVGKILYRNISDSCTWYEYRLLDAGTRKEKWLSIDDTYKEYSISECVKHADTNGYHEVDRGTEQVVGCWGRVDVDPGERASFTEYEDETEELIISDEVWSDGAEVSVGYYLDENEIQLITRGGAAGGNASYNSSGFGNSGFKGRGGGSGSGKNIIIVVAIAMLMVIAGKGAASALSINIEKYLKNSSNYTYVTSITGNEKQKADVYKSSLDLDSTAKAIIKGINGKVSNVQQNTEDGDNSIAILTPKEYCLVYQSDDNKDVLVQVSSRKYTYTSDQTPYRSRAGTHRYYRRYYYSTGYTADTKTYSSVNSSFGGFGDTGVSVNSADTYSSYASSVRQASAAARSSSGGGLSSGK